MPQLHPEPRKTPGVCYAVSDDGYELPIIDVTHPAFATVPPPNELEALRNRYVREMKLRAVLPGFARELLVKFMVSRSNLLRAAVAHRPGFDAASDAEQVYMSGTATYLMKLGPENLGTNWAKPLDRKLAATYAPMALRVRLIDTARLVADGLGRALAARPGSPVELVNVGGGPAMDSLNALILLRKEHPEWLAGRTVRIHVLDRDPSGPRFGARALAALQAAGAPLAGLDASLRHVAYDWNDVAPLKALLKELPPFAAMAGSTEGALFIYGTEAAVAANLAALREGTPEDFTLTGDFVVRNEANALGARETLLEARLFDPPEFASLCARAGCRIDATVDRTNAHLVRLAKA